MSYAKNEIETTDEYTDAATFLCPHSQVVEVQITNAAVYYQFQPVNAETPQGGEWQPEKRLLPGFYPFTRNLFAIRFRSAAVGKAAIVDVEGLTREDRGMGGPSAA